MCPQTAQHNLAGCGLDTPDLTKYQYMRWIISTQSSEPAMQEWVFYGDKMQILYMKLDITAITLYKIILH